MAAVSVLGAGLVKPDWGGESDAALAPEADQALASEPNVQADSRRRVRRVTEYVFLQPGERAPRGAKVISSDRLFGLTPNAREAPDAPRPDRPTARANEPRAPRSNRPAVPNDAPRNRAPQAERPQPERQTPPRVTTRQSG